ncbi:hypothetical protein FQA39_LY07205 [Lamprigera yunnana]|nr:hypothetical protein FQA39_LY07205 [Lamprigera yunnana]
MGITDNAKYRELLLGDEPSTLILYQYASLTKELYKNFVMALLLVQCRTLKELSIQFDSLCNIILTPNDSELIEKSLEVLVSKSNYKEILNERDFQESLDYDDEYEESDFPVRATTVDNPFYQHFYKVYASVVENNKIYSNIMHHSKDVGVFIVLRKII